MLQRRNETNACSVNQDFSSDMDTVHNTGIHKQPRHKAIYSSANYYVTPNASKFLTIGLNEYGITFTCLLFH